MKKELEDLNVTKLATGFSAVLTAEIARVAAGRRHEWDGNGVFTKLMLPEAQRLTVRYMAEANIDPAFAMTLVAKYPEALDSKVVRTGVTVAQAMVDAAELIIAKEIFTEEHEKIVIDQWDLVTFDQLLDFTRTFAEKMYKGGIILVTHRDQINDLSDLDAIHSALYQLEQAAYDEDEDRFGNMHREAEEYLHFIELVQKGKIDFEVVAKRVSPALA